MARDGGQWTSWPAASDLAPRPAVRSYSATHQQLKNHLITLQQSIQDTYSEVQVVKAQADRVAQAVDHRARHGLRRQR